MKCESKKVNYFYKTSLNALDMFDKGNSLKMLFN